MQGRLAGRVIERTAVRDVLSARPGVPALVVIGEAGVGKSRLVDAAALDAAERGVTVLWGWCLPLSQTLPLLPVLDVLAQASGLDAGRTLDAALDRCVPATRTEIENLLAGADVANTDSAASNSQWRRLRLFDAVRQAFVGLARHGATAAVIEDIHWADRTTLDLVEYLLAPGHRTGVPVVLTCRSEERHRLSDWLERLHRADQVRWLDLEPLDAKATAEQVRMLLDQDVASFATQVHARTDGNPFYTEQLVTHLGSESGHSAGERRLPPNLSALLLDRTRQVGTTAGELLRWLAVAGRPLDEDALRTLSALSIDDVRQALEHLASRRLLRPFDIRGQYQLRHALLGEALEQHLVPGERRDRHGTVADLLAASQDPTLAAVIAEHLQAAGRPDQELVWRVRAARRADAVYASQESADHWRRVLTLCADAPPDFAVEDVSLHDIYADAEDALKRTGNTENAGRLAEEAFFRLAEHSDTVRLAELYSRVGRSRAIRDPTAGMAALFRSLELYEQVPPTAGYLRVARFVASHLCAFGDTGRAWGVLEQVVPVADRVADIPSRANLLAIHAWMQMLRGAEEAALTSLESVYQVIAGHPDPWLALLIGVTHTDILLKLGDLESIPDVARGPLAMAAEHGLSESFETALLQSNVAEALTERGATAAAREFVEPVTRAQPNLSTWPIYQARAVVDLLTGDLDDSHRRWNQLEALHGSSLDYEVEFAAGVAEADLFRGAPRAALDRALPTLHRAAGTDASRSCGRLLTLAARACADLADPSRTAAERDAVGEFVRDLRELRAAMKIDPLIPGLPPVTGHADRLLWHAEFTRIEQHSDPELWREAAESYLNLARPHKAAYCGWQHAAAMMYERPRPADAGPALRRAAAHADGHQPLLAAIRTLARQARIPLDISSASGASAIPAPAHDQFRLTERELDVLRLVGQGRTNAQIGAALYISPKTASVHVTNILAKLHATSRVHAAAIAERAGLLG